MDLDLNGKPMDRETACSTDIVKCIPLEKPQNLIGKAGADPGFPVGRAAWTRFFGGEEWTSDVGTFR